MTEFAFYLYTNRYGERFICYESVDGYKIVEDFSKIPYTAESLFEDVLDGFSAYASIDDRALGTERYWRLREIYNKSYRYETILDSIHNDSSIEQVVYLGFCNGGFNGELNASRMNLNESVLFRDFRNYLVDYCEANDYELYLEEEHMKITQYVNLKDIRGYWEKIGYEPSALESAWLVWQSKNYTLEEKHKAWKEIIATMPDCAFDSHGIYDESNIDSVHTFLSEYMALENQLLERFYKKESNAVYTYKVWCDEDGGWIGSDGPLYVDFEQALAEFQNDADLCPRLALFTKVYFGAEHQRIYIYMRPDGAVTKVAADLIDLEEKEYKIFYEIFYGMELVFKSKSEDEK